MRLSLGGCRGRGTVCAAAPRFAASPLGDLWRISSGNIRSMRRGRGCGSSIGICIREGSGCGRMRAEYLVRRHKEPGEVYHERLGRVFYQNYIGSIIDWYAATLMRREPGLAIEGRDAGAKAFYGLLAENANLRGTRLSEFFRQRFIDALVCGASYVVVDFPRADQAAQNRAEEDAMGRSRAYLVDYGADEVINWDYDPRGGLDWAVIRTSWLRQAKVKDAKAERETRWMYYDRENFQIFRRSGRERADRTGGRRAARAGGLRQVPVFECDDLGGVVADEQGGAAAARTLQQIERAFVGADDGAVRDAGGVLGPGVEPDRGGVLLHPTWAGGPVRVDGAGGEGLPDRGGQPEPVERRDLPGVLPDEPGGRSGAAGARASRR